MSSLDRRASEARALAAVPQYQLDAYVEEQRAAGKPPSVSGAIRAAATIGSDGGHVCQVHPARCSANRLRWKEGATRRPQTQRRAGPGSRATSFPEALVLITDATLLPEKPGDPMRTVVLHGFGRYGPADQRERVYRALDTPNGTTRRLSDAELILQALLNESSRRVTFVCDELAAQVGISRPPAADATAGASRRRLLGAAESSPSAAASRPRGPGRSARP